ncbi:MAG: LD-carboxypeptidase [Bacteroidota bacterium]|nr:LD-carboxypeptidase [Bacteroidota bacterium]
MIRPRFLQAGDKVGIVAPARWVTEEELAPAVKLFESWGLEVVAGPHVHSQNNQFAGTDEERASDLQAMLDDESIAAIVCARGGYGTVRVLPLLNFEKFLSHPKWIVGYSDITALHSLVNRKYNVETIHALMPIKFYVEGSINPYVNSVKEVLFGKNPGYAFNPHPLNHQGSCKGTLLGGNLSVLYSLCGTDYDIDTRGKILFIEDLDEYLYHIDRMMMNFRLGHKLDQLAGLVIGGMSEMHDNAVPFGKTAEEIVADVVKDYKYPVAFGFPAGHIDDNQAMIMGREVSLEVNSTGSVLSF